MSNFPGVKKAASGFDWKAAGYLVSIGSVFLLGIGSIVLGIPIMILIGRRGEQKPFFRGESLHHDTPVLAPE